VAHVEITKAYLMLPVGDMDRAVSFYRDAVGLTVVFQSPYWSELRWRGATIALHGGGSGEDRESSLGFHVTDLDAALAEVGAAGGRPGAERTEGGARLVAVVDPEGNRFTPARTHRDGPVARPPRSRCSWIRAPSGLAAQARGCHEPPH
jgi:predicted enzyme related to lactoylglutathione lyase